MLITNELYKLRYLLFFEILLLGLFAGAGLIPFLALIILISLTILVLLAFNFPFIAIHILVFSILIDSFIPIKDSNGPTLLVVELFFIIVLGVSALKFLFNLDRKSEVSLLILIWIPFLVWSLFTGLAVAVDEIKMVAYWKNYFAGFFVLSLTYYAIKNKIHLKSVIFSIIIWGVLLALLEIKVLIGLGGFSTGIVGLFLKKNLLTLGWGRSNYLAAFFVVIIPFTIGYLLYSNSKKLKLVMTAAVVLMSFAIILTLSRGGILALFIALIILFSRVLKPKTFIPILTILILVTIVLLINPLTYVLIDRIASVETSASYFSRIDLYRDVWKTFLGHPIAGVGIGNLGYYAVFIVPEGASPSAHNIILGALGEVGIVGATFYFSLLGYLLYSIYKNFKRENDEALKIFKWCFISAFIGGLLHTLVEPTLDGMQFSIIFWTLAGSYNKLDMLRNSD